MRDVAQVAFDRAVRAVTERSLELQHGGNALATHPRPGDVSPLPASMDHSVWDGRRSDRRRDS